VRYLGEAPQGVYLIRPDQHIVARWPDFDASAVAVTLKTAIGKA
jgi:3-(3-hydroxy-phenyl)propionate hydroxylase